MSTGGLNIVIVGAGIAGLTAAVGLRKSGHNVTLLERSHLAQEVGAAIHLAPNCSGILKRLGVDYKNIGANPTNGMADYDFQGVKRLEIEFVGAAKMWENPWLLGHRVSLHNELKRLATDPDGEGPAAELRLDARVVDVDTETATVTLENGSKITGDFVIGADGVSVLTSKALNRKQSATRRAVIGDAITPFSSGKSAFRFLVPKDKVLANPDVRHLVEKDGYMVIWYGSDRRLIMYPCSNNTTMNFVGIHPSELSAASKGEGWERSSNKELLLSVYQDCGNVVQSLLSLADPSTLMVWTLLDMEELSHWVKNKVVLLGDAAHPFLPYQGQGGGIAIEDAASISVLFPHNTPKNEIPERLALFEKIRMHRAHKVQYFTRLAGADIDVRKDKLNISKFTNYNFGHDEWHNSTHELRKWLWCRNGNTYLRQPTSFGPMISPRQDHYGKPIPCKEAKFRTYSIRFKSSATYLRTLFPSASYSFTNPGTLVNATFVCTELSNLDWLGGGGYSCFGLWVHGVKYTRRDKWELFGSFLPVLFENLADPIIAGREEVAMPKLFCDIDVVGNEKSVKMTAGWRGVEFFSWEMDDLSERPKDRPVGATNTAEVIVPTAMGPPPPPENGLLVHRYVPAVGQKGTPDANYPVFISKEGATTERIVEKTLTAREARVSAHAGDWKTLPTLHHVATALADVPIYEIIEAKVEEGHGIEDLSQAVRIE